jgi:uncharacterized membrane protein YraQ (UPF0718 family)
MSKEKIKKALRQTVNNFKMALPIMIGVFLLLSLISPFIKKYSATIFSGNIILDPLIGSLAGSISFGIPITSYIAGGELLGSGVNLMAVTAFMLAWTTVGIAMLPLEISTLGKKFAITRNIVNFLFSIIIAILAVATLNII